jgi:hypothetical protein
MPLKFVDVTVVLDDIDRWQTLFDDTSGRPPR